MRYIELETTYVWTQNVFGPSVDENFPCRIVHGVPNHSFLVSFNCSRWQESNKVQGAQFFSLKYETGVSVSTAVRKYTWANHALKMPISLLVPFAPLLCSDFISSKYTTRQRALCAEEVDKRVQIAGRVKVVLTWLEWDRHLKENKANAFRWASFSFFICTSYDTVRS